MTSKAAVDDFIVQRKLAVVGVSRDEKKFGSIVYQELKNKDCWVFPVNTNTERIGDDPCYPDLLSLPEPVEGVVVVMPQAAIDKIIQDVVAAGIPRVWLQKGAESEAAIRYAEEQGISVVHGECILMFAEPTAFGHRMHRWIWKILGNLPKQVRHGY
jgi:predicted CoA-binding protein